MSKKGRSGGRRFRVGKYVNLMFKVLGAAVTAGPAIHGVQDHMNDPKEIPNAVLYYYTGIPKTGPWNSSVAAQGAGAVFGGVILAKIGAFLGRRF